jgi:hypothetical protein
VHLPRRRGGQRTATQRKYVRRFRSIASQVIESSFQEKIGHSLLCLLLPTMITMYFRRRASSCDSTISMIITESSATSVDRSRRKSNDTNRLPHRRRLDRCSTPTRLSQLHAIAETFDYIASRLDNPGSRWLLICC